MVPRILAVPLLASLFLPAPASSAPRVAAARAHEVIGKEATVCGRISDASYRSSIGGRPTFLNFDRPYPNHTFTVVIWGDVRDRFEKAPEAMFEGAHVCVTGRVETYRGKPQIVLRDPKQILVAGSPFPVERFSYEERVVVKAVLDGLGYRADYGSGEWDEEAEGALREFQADAGLTGGEADAGTLRKLAEAVGELGEEEARRILQAFLLNLAQREN